MCPFQFLVKRVKAIKELSLTIFEKLPMSPKKSVGEFEIRGGGEGV